MRDGRIRKDRLVRWTREGGKTKRQLGKVLMKTACGKIRAALFYVSLCTLGLSRVKL